MTPPGDPRADLSPAEAVELAAMAEPRGRVLVIGRAPALVEALTTRGFPPERVRDTRAAESLDAEFDTVVCLEAEPPANRARLALRSWIAPARGRERRVEADPRRAPSGAFTRPERRRIGRRVFASARRRHIDRLIIVAAPTSAGKSTLIRRLQSGELPELAAALELDPRDGWPLVSAALAHERAETDDARLVYHLDVLSPHYRHPVAHAANPSLEILEAAGQRSFVTLVASCETLSRQLHTGNLAKRSLFGVYLGRRRYLRTLRTYRSPAEVSACYGRWLDFAAHRPGRHWFVTQESGLRVWPEEARSEAFEACGLPPP